MTQNILIATLLLTSITACASAPEATLVYLSSGAKQCENNSGQSLAVTANLLAEAGITATHGQCAKHGNPIMAMCGAPAANIHVYSINKNDLIQAEALGFKAIETLANEENTGYRITDCQ